MYVIIGSHFVPLEGKFLSAIFRTRTFKNLKDTGLETRKGDG
jgi:hypothetical protein